jgi:light-regulated signal transduction histidine kinase (bacteriophytochrome)
LRTGLTLLNRRRGTAAGRLGRGGRGYEKQGGHAEYEPIHRVIWDGNMGDKLHPRHATGEGIPAEKRQSIFESVVQVKSGFTREHDGVGPGLAISGGLARMMHGDLTVTSKIGKGSELTLILPRSQ